MLVYGVEQRQRESQVEEGEPEWLTMHGRVPKQHDFPGLKKVNGHTERPHLSSVSQLIGNPADMMSDVWRWPLIVIHLQDEVKILPVNGWGVKHTFKQIMMEEGGAKALMMLLEMIGP